MERSLKYLLGFAIILGVICFACYQLISLFFPTCHETNIELRKSVHSDNFDMDWMMPDVFLLASNQAIYMVANETHIVLYGRVDSRCGNPRLINLNSDNGTIFREGVTAMPANRGIDQTAYNSDYFYLGYNGTGKTIETSTIDSGGIAAYDINRGEIYWTQTISGTRSMFSLVSSNDVVRSTTTRITH